MDAANAREAIKEMDLDIAEGADIVMGRASTGVSRHHHNKQQHTNIFAALQRQW